MTRYSATCWQGWKDCRGPTRQHQHLCHRRWRCRKLPLLRRVEVLAGGSRGAAMSEAPAQNQTTTGASSAPPASECLHTVYPRRGRNCGRRFFPPFLCAVTKKGGRPPGRGPAEVDTTIRRSRQHLFGSGSSGLGFCIKWLLFLGSWFHWYLAAVINWVNVCHQTITVL